MFDLRYNTGVQNTEMPGGAVNTPGAVDLERRPTMSSISKSPKKEQTFIYALKDPRDGSIRYVGKSNTPQARYYQHLADRTSNPYKAAWITELRRAGLKPELEVLERVPVNLWPDAECHWIDLGYVRGWPLTNIAPGGFGAFGAVRESEWDEIMFGYLPEDLWNRFCAMDENKKRRICHLTAMRMMDVCWVAIKARGGNPHEEYDRESEYWRGSYLAQTLVLADDDMFEYLADAVEGESNETHATVKRFAKREYGV